MPRRTTVALATALSATLLTFGAPALAAPSSTSAAPVVVQSAAGASAAKKKAKKPKPRAYRNCTALNKVYKHGVARKGAKDRVKGKTKPVRTFTVDTAAYRLNTKSDRDKDGVACEKR